MKDVESAIRPYNDDQLSVIAEGGRQGQTTRFELMLLAALGERFIECHPWKDGWFVERRRNYLKRFQDAGIKISNYDTEPPRSESPAEL